jgi:hypothetical protein
MTCIIGRQRGGGAWRRAPPRSSPSHGSGHPRRAAIDVRGFVESVDVVPAGGRAVCGALDWERGPLVRARVTVAPDGSAKPIEVARALGLAGGDSPTAPRCRLARLGFVGPA